GKSHPSRAGRAHRSCGCARVILLCLWPADSPSRAQPRTVRVRVRDELQAVLEHEQYHVCNLDPLKALLVRALSTALFFLPALDSLCARYLTGRELAADRCAISVCGPRPLAGALLKVVRGPEWSELDLAAPIGGLELLDVRVAQLETGTEPKLQAPSVVPAALSLLGAALFIATFLVSVSSFGGPTAVYRTTGTGLAATTLLGGLSCAAPFAGMGLLAYLIIALRASRPLRSGGRQIASSDAEAFALPLRRTAGVLCQLSHVDSSSRAPGIT